MNATIRACASLFKIRVAENLQYRAAAVAGASIGVFWVAINITVFTIFFTYGNILDRTVLTLPQVISYEWLGQVLFAMNYLNIDDMLRTKIVNGDIGVELCRPVDFYTYWFTQTSAGRIGGALWRMLLTLAVGILIPAPYGLALPASGAGFMLFLITATGSYLLCISYTMLITAVRLGITWGEGPVYMLALLGMVLGGGYLPLQLWPDFMQKFLLIQPFAGYMDIPLRLYIGSMSVSEALPAIGLQFFWIIVFLTAGKLLMTRKLKNIIVQGG